MILRVILKKKRSQKKDIGLNEVNSVVWFDHLPIKNEGKVVGRPGKSLSRK